MSMLFEVGDHVVISYKIEFQVDFACPWAPEMDKLIGSVGVVEGINHGAEEYRVKCIDGHEWFFLSPCLTHIKEY